MINKKIVFQVLGLLLFLEALMLGASLGVGLLFAEEQVLPFGIPIAICIAIGILLRWLGHGAENRLSRRDGLLIVSLTWVVFSTIGMLPFLINGNTSRVAVAFFETMSGFTTTGASAFSNIDALPHSILFWRSLTHWIGGMGIVFFTLAVLPQIGSGDQRLFSVESTGLKLGKLHPRISTTARWLWGLYLMLTLTCTAAYYLCGMNLFDAVNHALSTIATGGFSTHTSSIAFFGSPLIEYVSAVFMFLASINFTLLYLFIIKYRVKQVLGDDELRFYAAMVSISIIVVGITLFFAHDGTVESCLRKALFNVVSLVTTTGFTCDDFMLWHPSIWLILTVISCIGACAGSTGGGIKCVRIMMAYKIVRNEFRHILHPHAVFPIRINSTLITEDISRTVFAYFTIYGFLITMASGIMTCIGIPMLDAFGLSISSFSNIGPSIGRNVGPLAAWDILPDTCLWICSFLMLAGRLEIFALLLPFFPAFWKDS